MIVTSLATLKDIEGILLLQEKNLFSNLTPNERKNGFVTTPFTINQIKEILKQQGLFVAKNNNNNIIAYAFAGNWIFFKQWDIFNYMIARFPKLAFNNKNITTKNSFQYGPVCIDKNYRGKGILNLIFEEMRIEFVKKYPISITFINKINVISKQAHTKKLGWEIIDEFNFNNSTYLGLAFDMSKSVVNPTN
jgi:hypothetical protein